MNKRTLTALTVGLLSVTVGAQVVDQARAPPSMEVARSHHCDVTQNPAANTWTAMCTYEATGVDTKKTYWGDAKIAYAAGSGGDVMIMPELSFSVGPTARTFVEESPGNYRLEAKLTKRGVSLSFQATLYGALCPEFCNRFYMSGRILELDGPVVHAGWQNVTVYGPLP